VPGAPVAPLTAGIDMLFDWPCSKYPNYVDAGRSSECSPANGHAGK
jgi:hypothetical protein